mmetsp:Transcript_5555/g.16574  ORF Transcript_5555/g.16574 Transcript_5555/m.16574 type:complete len:206 (+) Transcript_5555:1126-1743(+)
MLFQAYSLLEVEICCVKHLFSVLPIFIFLRFLLASKSGLLRFPLCAFSLTLQPVHFRLLKFSLKLYLAPFLRSWVELRIQAHFLQFLILLLPHKVLLGSRLVQILLFFELSPSFFPRKHTFAPVQVVFVVRTFDRLLVAHINLVRITSSSRRVRRRSSPVCSVAIGVSVITVVPPCILVIPISVMQVSSARSVAALRSVVSSCRW